MTSQKTLIFTLGVEIEKSTPPPPPKKMQETLAAKKQRYW